MVYASRSSSRPRVNVRGKGGSVRVGLRECKEEDRGRKMESGGEGESVGGTVRSARRGIRSR